MASRGKEPTRESDALALVVDDEAPVREATRRSLTAVGFLCDGASNGEEALALANEKKYDVIITDLAMPQMHGHTLITRLMESPSPPMIVVLTAVGEPKIVLDLYSRGVAEVAIKPVEYSTFAAKVRALHELHNRSLPAGPTRESMALKVSQDIHQVADELQSSFTAIQTEFEQTIANLRMQEKDLEESFLGSLRMITALNEKKGEEETSHSGRVEAIVSRIAPYFDFEGLHLRALKVASLLHDIGQFSLPDHIRTRHPWNLVKKDLPVYQNYPSVGAMLLSQVPGSDQVSEWIEAHQEKHDGSGFPHRLRGNQIPMGARIIHIADGIDLFRMFYTDEEDAQSLVLSHLQEERGKSYDPKLVDFILSKSDEVFPLSGERQVFVVGASELKSQLVLAEDLYDAAGLLLIRRGAVISDAMLPRVKLALGKRTIKVTHLT